MKKLKPKVLSNEARERVMTQAGAQEESRSIPKSLDPKHFPVFEIPVDAKALIYVPNHVVMNSEGVAELRMDKPLIHSVQDGKRFMKYRCIYSITDEGYSGECPLCDATDDCFTLANHKIAEQCSIQGLDAEDKENKAVKSVRSTNFGAMVIKQPKRYYIFPIVVFETLNDDGKNMVKDENGAYKFRIYWYEISQAMYDKVWKKTLDGMEDEPSHPGGHCFLLNYTGNKDKMTAALNFSVAARNIKGLEKVTSQLDKLTEGWTPAKCSETVLSAVFYEEADLQEVADEVMEPTRNMISVYEASKVAGGAGAVESKEEPIFKLDKKEPQGATPVEGLTTDLDDDTDGLPIE